MERIEDLYPALQELVRITTGVDLVILANQGAPAPEGLYATYSLTPIRAYGHSKVERELTPATEPTDPALGDWQDFHEKVLTQMHCMLSVNILNAGASTAALKLHNANFRAPVRDFLFRNRIGWRYASDSRNLTGRMQAGIQPRYQVDIHLFIEAEVSYTVLRAAGFNVEINGA